MGYVFGANFAALLAEYESTPAGMVVLTAYQDPKGKWTGPGGMTFHQDGRPVQGGDMWTEQGALDLIAFGKRAFAAEVSAALPDGFVPTQNQFDALGFIAWNAGSHVVSHGSVAEALRQGRLEEVARNMTLYRRMTLWGGDIGPDGTPVRGPDGIELADGVSWFKAMRGILRRSFATACLFLSLDWREATSPRRVKLAKRPDWVPSENRWVDTVVDQTSWKAVKDMARLSPLPDGPAMMEADGRAAAAAPPVITKAVVPVTGREAVVMVRVGHDLHALPDEWDLWTEAAKSAWIREREVPGGPAAPKPTPLPPTPAAKPKATASRAPAVPVDQVPYLDEAAKKEVKTSDMADTQRGTGFARQKQAEAVGTVMVGGWIADQMGIVKPILDFTAKYTPSQMATGALLVGVPTVGLWYYGKWRRRKGERDATTLIR